MKRRLFLITVLTITVIAMSTVFASAASPKISVSVKTKTDSRKVTVKVSTKKSTLKKGTVYRMYFRMYNGKHVTKQKLVKIDLKKKNKKNVSVTLPYYGQYKMQGYLYKGKKKVASYKAKKVNVKASEYNILELRATTPVLVSTIKFLGNMREDGKPTYTTTESGKSIPTMVALSRTKQYNWEKLPKDWYDNPVAYKATTGNKQILAMKAYVKNLFAASPKAKFHIYINDYDVHELADISYKLGIPDEQLTVTFVTDGSASYVWFKNTYGECAEGEAQVLHEKLMSDYQKYRNAMIAGRDYTIKYDQDEYHPMRKYVYAALEIENMNGVKTDWWVIRKSNDTFELQDKSFQAKAVGDARITSNYLNGLLSTLQKTPEMEKVFKELYNFDDSKIKNAIAKGKKPMMILGTAKSIETADPITPFIKFLKMYYGEDYQLLYKGHPGFITEDDPERMATMKELDVEVLDSSIAAELFLYYNPGLYMSGFQSTTFLSAESEEHIGGMYNERKEQALVNFNQYADKIKFFMCNLNSSKMQDTPRDNAIKALGVEGHDCFVIDLCDKLMEDTGNAIGIYDDTAGTVTWYKEGAEGEFTPAN